VKLQEVFLSFLSQVFAEYLILRKFYDRHHDMVNCYGKSVSQMIGAEKGLVINPLDQLKKEHC
jgi:hypothetical protein